MSSSNTDKKVTVAVAGVTSGLGHAIASALLSLPYSNFVSVTLLTRQSTELNPVLKPLLAAGAILKEVDYTSVDTIVSALQDIHTVISTIHGFPDIVPAQNLIEGAKAAGVKRFAPSEFITSIEYSHKFAGYASKVILWEQVQKSGMEYTAFSPGLFMDYLTFGSPFPYEGPLKRFPYLVNVSQRKADIPGTGNERVTFTTLEDIGKFIASACVDQSPWPVESGMAGETTTYNRIIQQAEDILGEKFAVIYYSKEELEKQVEDSNAAGNVFGASSAQFQISVLEGKGEISPTILNEKFGEMVKPKRVADILKKYWG